MLYYVKRGGQKGRFGCSPGCFVISLVLSVVLTILLNLIIWAFTG